MTDSRVAEALRECEEAVEIIHCSEHSTGMQNVFAAIVRYGDLREKAGFERGIAEWGSKAREKAIKNNDDDRLEWTREIGS